jgi:ribonuclease HI
MSSPSSSSSSYNKDKDKDNKKPALSIIIPVALKYKTEIGTPSPVHKKTDTNGNNNAVNAYEYILNFDGASRGNPGPAGIGAVIFHNGKEIWASCQYIGTKTNNQSEYSALILGLKEALTRDIKCLQVYGDSQLVINQINGEYKVKNPGLQDLYKEVQDLQAHFESIVFTHVYREFNKRADQLSNMALDVLDVNEDNGKTGLQLPPLLENEISSLKVKQKPIIKQKTSSKMKTLLFPDI